MKIKLSALMISAFFPMWRAIRDHTATHYWLDGGRGSTKSSFISLAIVLLIIKFPFANAVIIRKVANTLRDSVYSQMRWAISALGVSSYFKCSLSPLEITYLPTGQKIVFRGADKPEKLKSTALEHGYFSVVWFEELDQFEQQDIGTILKSFMRGGDKFWIFYSYNPPRTLWSWVNKEALAMKQRDDAITSHSSYLDVVDDHLAWLGTPFIDEAEHIRDTNPRQYKWEYLGEITGTGGSVFENLTSRSISDEEIETYDHHLNGCDFGWFPDPWRFVRAEWQHAERRLIIYDERSANKKIASDTGNIIKEALTYTDVQNSAPTYHRETVWCDAADNTSIATYRRSCGVNARPARKGNMRHVSYQWLAGLREIVIDPKRCPLTYEEFALCEYAKDRQGNWIDDYNDGNDHSIDAVRYATMELAIRGR